MVPEQIAITKRSGVPGMFKVLPVVTLVMMLLLFSVSPCQANESQAGYPSYDTSGYNMDKGMGWKPGGPSAPVESPPANQTPAQQPPAQTPDPQPAPQPTPTKPDPQPAPQPTPTKPDPQPVQQPAPQPVSPQPGEGANQQGPPTSGPGDDLNFEWSDQKGAQDSLPQDPDTMQPPDPQPDSTESGEGANQQGPPVPGPGDDLDFEESDQGHTPGSFPQDPNTMQPPTGEIMGTVTDSEPGFLFDDGDTHQIDLLLHDDPTYTKPPWWVKATIETIMDAMDYVPTNNIKAVYNAVDHFTNGEYVKMVQEIAFIPLAWVGTFIGHTQKATGLELTIENLEKWFGEPPKPQEPVKPPEKRQDDPNWWLTEEQPVQ